MKRSGFLKRKTPLRAKTGLKRYTKLRVVGHSDTADIKADIQNLLRHIVIIRDQGCVLRHYYEAGSCGGMRSDGKLILQAEHLIGRSNSATYADPRNIVCLCRHHHGHWKPQNSRLYWELIEKHIGPERWKWIRLMEADKRAHKADWKLCKVALEAELKKLQAEVQSVNTRICKDSRVSQTITPQDD